MIKRLGYADRSMTFHSIIDVPDILDIHKCLIKKYDIKQCLVLLKDIYWITKRSHSSNF